MPYMYIKTEPCYARAWFPCQDTPAAKIKSWELYVTVEDQFKIYVTGLWKSTKTIFDPVTGKIWKQ